MRALTISLLFLFLATAASAQQPGANAKLEELERKLDEATRQLEQAGSVIRLVREEISRLKGEAFNSSNARADQQPGATKQAAPENPKDAFIEYYLSDHATVRVGQFIKPFGFQIQQSSARRESPERGILESPAMITRMSSAQTFNMQLAASDFAVSSSRAICLPRCLE